MGQRKIVVPEGMLEAAMMASMEAGLAIGPSTELRIPFEAALLWLSENPIEPTNEQIGAMVNVSIDKFGIEWQRMSEWTRVRILCTEFQRQMFTEPEVPEDVYEFIFPDTPPDVKERIVEAYLRGQKAGKQCT